MKHARAVAVLIVAGALAPACGGGRSPAAPVAATPPPTPAPTPIPPPVARDGLTHNALSAEITPPAPRAGEAVTGRASGYLVREQAFDGGALFLWPGEQDYVNELVYHLQFTDDSYRMVRWTGGFTVTVDEEIAANDSAMRKTREVVDELVRHTGLPITIGPGGAVRVMIDGSILDEFDAIGLASWTFRGPAIVGAEVKFARMQEVAGGVNADYANTYLHEMGHVLGLGHSPSSRDVMTPGTGPGSRVGELPDEAAILHMMYAHRAAGNIAPDRDPVLSARSLAVPRTRSIRN